MLQHVSEELGIKCPYCLVSNLVAKLEPQYVEIPLPLSHDGEYYIQYKYRILCPHCGRILDETWKKFTVHDVPQLALPDVDDGSKLYLGEYIDDFTTFHHRKGILPCPKCGKIDYVSLDRYRDPHDDVYYYVACHDSECSTQGKFCETSDEAIMDWNDCYSWETIGGELG